jgi:hypothetical protein
MIQAPRHLLAGSIQIVDPFLHDMFHHLEPFLHFGGELLHPLLHLMGEALEPVVHLLEHRFRVVLPLPVIIVITVIIVLPAMVILLVLPAMSMVPPVLVIPVLFVIIPVAFSDIDQEGETVVVFLEIDLDLTALEQLRKVILEDLQDPSGIDVARSGLSTSTGSLVSGHEGCQVELLDL